MKERKVPLRKCAGCGESKPKKELVRVVRAPDGTVSLDLVGKKPGRGAYVCPKAACLAKARKAKRIERALEVAIPPKYTTPCRAKLPARRKQMQQHKAVFALSLCRKAGALVTGFDAVKESVYQGKAALVLCAQDASEGTQARVRRFCEGLCQVLTLPCTQAQLAAVTKKNTAVLAVQNAELAKLCASAAGTAPSHH